MKYLLVLSILLSLFFVVQHSLAIYKAKKAKNWEILQIDDYHVHVTPRNDTMLHMYSDHCSCGVMIEPVKRKDGSIGWLSTHHAQDGREN